MRGHGRVYNWRDGGIVPVICPTCQSVFAAESSIPAALCFQGVPFFAWGCFRYFCLPRRSSRAGLPCALSSVPIQLERKKALDRNRLDEIRNDPVTRAPH